MYARLYGIAPHDPVLDHISPQDLDVFIEAWFSFRKQMENKESGMDEFKSGVEKARERFRKRAQEQVAVTPQELWGEG